KPDANNSRLCWFKTADPVLATPGGRGRCGQKIQQRSSPQGKEATKMQRTQSQCGAISLRRTLAKARFLASEDVIVSSCASDWRACRAGDLFFAVTTADDDGHEHAADAIERGAVAVVAERLLPVGVPQILVRDSRAAMARVCQALAGHPSRDLRTIGIAGSAG